MMNGYNLKQRIAALLMGTALGLLANWIRIFALIIIGHITEMQSSLMSDHEFFGWALFAAILFPSIYFSPAYKIKEKIRLAPSFTLPRIILALTCLSAGPLIVMLSGYESEEKHPYIALPSSYTVDQDVSLPVAQYRIDRGHRSSGYLSNEQVYVQIDQYRKSDANQKLVPYFRSPYNRALWLIEHTEIIEAVDQTATMTTFRRKGTNNRVMQVQWFNTGGFGSSTIVGAKLAQFPAILLGRNTFDIYTIQLTCFRHCEKDQLVIASKKFYYLLKEEND